MRKLATLSLVVGLALLAHARPASGPLAPQTAEEETLWRRVSEEQETLERSGFALEEPEVTTYLQLVITRLAQADGLDAGSFSVKVLRDPSLNAFAYPNGRIYIHSGLLARMLNEAHLATVLSHEMTHAINRHALKAQRDLKAKAGILGVISTVSSVAGDYRGLVDLLGAFGTLAAVSGYSRGLETEADQDGWSRMVKAGYDVTEAPAIFRMLMADLDAHDRKEPYFFGSHPKLASRESEFKRLNASRKKAAPGEKGEDRFARATRIILRINGELEMRAGRTIAARDQLWRFRAAEPGDVRVRWLIGENERLAGAQGNLAEARKVLEEAISMDETFAPPHRSLGLILYRSGAYAEAAPRLRRFLELDPGAQDRAYIQTYIEKCEPTSSS